MCRHFSLFLLSVIGSALVYSCKYSRSTTYAMPPSHHSKKAIVDSLITGSGRSKVGGVLCNDVNGLCLVSEGAMRGDPGVYTNLVRLASQLSPQDQGNMPLITLESQSSAVLLKEYDGRTVAIQVPTASLSTTTLVSGSASE